MAGDAIPIRYRHGTVEVDDEGLRLHKSPAHVLAAQRARWHEGDVRSRAGALLRVLWMVSAPAVAVMALAVALGVNPWTRVGTVGRVMQAAAGGMILLLVGGFFRSARVPFGRLEDGVTARGARTLRLPPRALGRPAWLDPSGQPSQLVFPNGDDRDRVVALLEGYGVDIEYEPGATRATYKLVREGGGYFCPACDGRVSADDSACSACGESLTDGQEFAGSSRAEL